MWKWAQGAVASVTGAAEPEYGAEAFQAIDKTVEGKNPFGALTRTDLEWQQPAQSHVETQTFYFNQPGGYYGFAQLIHSNPVNLAFTSQFTFLILDEKRPDFKVWTSTRLDGADIQKTDFHADGFDIELSEAGDEYKFTSVVNEESQVQLVFRRVGDGFKIGADGISKYGEDLSAPWGVMRHLFWPRVSVSGKIIIKDETVQLKEAGGMYVMALQGMKPHHAAARWNFLNFQGPTVSVVVMEFVTPPSYGSSRSSIGAVVQDGKLLATAVNVEIEHLDAAEDDVGWPKPGAIRFQLDGPKVGAADADVAVEANRVKVTVAGKLSHTVDRVDVMAEIPAFVKRLASGVSGARPYIYQYRNALEAKIEVDGKIHTETGDAYNEATFIS